MRDPAFQSQQFAQDSDRRKEAYILQQGQALQQGLPAAVDQYLEAQKTKTVIATQEAERQQALDNMAWLQQIHGAKQAEYQTRAMKAGAELAEAQTQKAIQDLNAPTVRDPGFSDEEIEEWEARGHTLTFNGGRVVSVPTSPEKQAAAQKKVTRRANYKKYRSPVEAADAGEVWDPKIDDYRPGKPEELAAVASRHSASLSHSVPTAAARDKTADLRMLEDSSRAIDRALDDLRHHKKLTKPGSPEEKADIEHEQSLQDRKRVIEDIQKTYEDEAAERRGLSGQVPTNAGTLNQPTAADQAKRDAAKSLKQMLDALNQMQGR